MQMLVAELSAYKELLVVWVPEHCDIRGNNLADELAKFDCSTPQPDLSRNVGKRHGNTAKIVSLPHPTSTTEERLLSLLR